MSTLDDLLVDIAHAGNVSFSDGVTFCPGEQTSPYLSCRERCYDHSLFFCRWRAVLVLHFGDFEQFNDCAIRLLRNWNRYELVSREGDDLSDKRMQYPHAIQALMVHAYNHTIKFFVPGGVYKGNLMALGLSFLEVAYFFGGQFRDPAFTGWKKHQAHDSNLLRKNGEGHQTGMDELLNTNEGVAGRFYMDVDTLAHLYSDMAHQLRYQGEFPRSPQHTTVTKWRAAWDKFVDETIEKIGQQYWCRKIKQGRTYPSCLRQSGLLDHAFPLPEDDPQYRPPE